MKDVAESELPGVILELAEKAKEEHKERSDDSTDLHAHLAIGQKGFHH